jgi:DNA-binding response OmpR family regulator
VICEHHLPDGTWLDILNHLDGSIEKPLLVVTSRFADEALWAEVLNLGGFDVIAKPFDPKGARHVLETACLRRQIPNTTRARQMLVATAT